MIYLVKYFLCKRIIAYGVDKNMYVIAICDDSSLDRMALRKKIEQNSELQMGLNFYEYRSGKELLDGMDKIKFSMIFLDIQMPEMGGEIVAEEIRKRDMDVILMFCAGYADPTPHSIKVQPFRFMKKGMPEEDKRKDINDAIQKMIENAQVPSFLGKMGSRRLILKPNDIVYIEKYKKSVKVHISNAAKKYHCIQTEDNNEPDIRFSEKLGVLYDELKEFGFGYPHDSYIINFKYMTSCSENEIKLEGFQDMVFKVSRSKAVEFNRLKREYLTAKYGR